MEITKESGIYEIVNIINNKRYIGQAKNIYARFHQHFYSLRLGEHYNKHLQKSFNKYGESAFKFNPIIIVKNPAPGILDKLEELLFSEFNFENELYNIARFANTTTWLKYTDEQRRNVSISQDKYKQPIAQYDLVTRRPIKTYESAYEAARLNNINMSGIRHCARGKQQTYKGYIWRFTSDDREILLDLDKLKCREFFQINIETDEVINTFKTIISASRSINLNKTSISRALNNKQSTAGGYKWRYKPLR